MFNNFCVKTESNDEHSLVMLFVDYGVKFCYLDHNSSKGNFPHLNMVAKNLVNRLQDSVPDNWTVLGISVEDNSVFNSVISQKSSVVMIRADGYIYKSIINNVINKDTVTGTYKRYRDSEFNNAHDLEKYCVKYSKIKEITKPIKILKIDGDIAICECDICGSIINNKKNEIQSSKNRGGCRECKFTHETFNYDEYISLKNKFITMAVTYHDYNDEYNSKSFIPHEIFKHYYLGDSAELYTQRIIDTLLKLDVNLRFEGYTLSSMSEWNGNTTDICISYKGFYTTLSLTYIIDSNSGWKYLKAYVDQKFEHVLSTVTDIHTGEIVEYLDIENLVVNKSNGHVIDNIKLKLCLERALDVLYFGKAKLLGLYIKKSSDYRGTSTKVVIDINGHVHKTSQINKFINSNGDTVPFEKSLRFTRYINDETTIEENSTVFKYGDDYLFRDISSEYNTPNKSKPYDLEQYVIRKVNELSKIGIDILYLGIKLPYINSKNDIAILVNGMVVFVTKYDKIFETKNENESDVCELYLQKLKLDDNEIIKIGIAINTDNRIKSQKESGSKFEHEKMFVWKGKKSEINLVETLLLRIYGNYNGACEKALLPSGFSETLPIDKMGDVLDFINKSNNLTMIYNIK